MPMLGGGRLVIAGWMMSAALVASVAWGQDGFECTAYSDSPTLLMALEDDATKGGLSDAEKGCLEDNYAVSEVQTTKDKISRVLLVNAYAYSTKDWAELVRRHLDEVDRSDPDIAYLYAFYLYNAEGADSEEVIRWTNVALDRRDLWTGDVYVSRVYGLMKLKSIASADAWKDAAEAAATAPEKVDELRNRTKTFAREWVDFAKVAGKDMQESLDVCLSAATRRKACGLEE
jgi:hypothetical protein